jgi:hypothetical protein
MFLFNIKFKNTMETTKLLKSKIKERQLGNYLDSLTEIEVGELLVDVYLSLNQVELRDKIQKSKEKFDLTNKKVVWFLCSIYNDAFSDRLALIHETWDELTLIKLDEYHEPKKRTYDEEDKERTKKKLIKLLDEETNLDLYYRFRTIIENFYKYGPDKIRKRGACRCARTKIEQLNQEIKVLVSSYPKVPEVD